MCVAHLGMLSNLLTKQIDMNLSQPEVTKMATRMRTLFSKRKRLNFPNFRLNERQRKAEFWEKSALACYEAGADPRDWIEAAFMYNTVSGGPYGQCLHGNAMHKWYAAYIKKNSLGQSVGSITSRVKFDFEVLAECVERNNSKAIEEQQTLEQILVDPFTKIAPYVAVVVLPKSYAVRIKFLDKARNMISGSVAYLDSISELGFDTDILSNESITPLTTL